jgi:hypothetical protein
MTISGRMRHVLAGDDDESRAVADAEFQQQMADVHLRGGVADVEAFGDLASS